jgi:MFS family permease
MFFMLMVTVALKKMGIKWAMVLGLVALLVRYVAFYCGGRFDMPWLYFVAILVHGIIFGFFFVGGQIYINKKAPKEMQAQAQGFIFLISFGIGLTVGNYFNGWLIDTNMTRVAETVSYDWNSIWGVTTGISLALLAIFLVLFNDKFGSESGEELKADEETVKDAVEV